MRKFLSQSVLFAAIAALSVATAGCGYYNGLKAKREFRDANGLYQSSDYKAAAAKYEEVVALPEDVLHQFHLEPAYFFLANSYDNLFRGAKKGDATNDASIPWPAEREQVDVGTLTLDKVESDDNSAARDINFDPLVLPAGIAPSDDPVLSARSAVYSQSYTRRVGESRQPSAITPADTSKGD